jgi:hypothetical protein
MPSKHKWIGEAGSKRPVEDKMQIPSIEGKDMNQAGTPVAGNAKSLSNIQMLYGVGGVLQASSSIIGSMAKASAIRASGKFEEAGFIENAKRLELAAKDAKTRGNKEVHRHMQRVRKLMGSQRAALAASGVDIDSGSARDIQLETLELGQEDASTMRTNIMIEAHGFKRQAIENKFMANTKRIARKSKEKATLLSGRLNAVNSISNTAIKMNKAGSA